MAYPTMAAGLFLLRLQLLLPTSLLAQIITSALLGSTPRSFAGKYFLYGIG